MNEIKIDINERFLKDLNDCYNDWLYNYPTVIEMSDDRKSDCCGAKVKARYCATRPFRIGICSACLEEAVFFNEIEMEEFV